MLNTQRNFDIFFKATPNENLPDNNSRGESACNETSRGDTSLNTNTNDASFANENSPDASASCNNWHNETSRKVSAHDLEIVEQQLGRTPRDVHAISYRCPCGGPAVVETPPRLSDGTPFPTFYYATCPNLTASISTLETTGLMGEMNERLATDAVLSGEYYAAHVDYEAARDALNIDVPEVKGITAGGMPERVKCLHSLIAHSLSVGVGVNPLGDEALAKLDAWWCANPCSEQDKE